LTSIRFTDPLFIQYFLNSKVISNGRISARGPKACAHIIRRVVLCPSVRDFGLGTDLSGAIRRRYQPACRCGLWHNLFARHFSIDEIRHVDMRAGARTADLPIAE
jgi:hypothetical protein